FFQAEDGIRDRNVTGVQTCALPISRWTHRSLRARASDLCRLCRRRNSCHLLTTQDEAAVCVRPTAAPASLLGARTPCSRGWDRYDQPDHSGDFRCLLVGPLRTDFLSRLPRCYGARNHSPEIDGCQAYCWPNNLLCRRRYSFRSPLCSNALTHSAAVDAHTGTTARCSIDRSICLRTDVWPTHKGTSPGFRSVLLSRAL